MSTELRLGPMLRHVTETTAVIWVETDAACTVTVSAQDVSVRTETFTVHGHHYALCELEGLAPGKQVPYQVYLDETRVWPEADSPYPPSTLRPLDHSAPARLLFGSCHTPTDHSAAAVLRYGVDMLRAYALRLAAERVGDIGNEPAAGEPTALLLIGDQVYADELQESMEEFLAHRREGEDERDRAPDDEVVFFDEYAELYRQAWTDPDIRWLLSTVPTLMLFDDHDIRDDWNTSGTWREQIARTPWWRPRITSGLGTYWIYQHLGNLSPETRAADPVWQEMTSAGDGGAALDAFAWRAHSEPTSYRWSHRHDFGRSRVVMVDTRCGRDVADDRARSILGPDDSAWLDEQLSGDVDHLVLASTLPFLMPAGVHYLEAWNEALCAGAWGRWLRGPSEKLRQEVDLEHWPAFQRSFGAVAEAVLEVAGGKRGAAPASVLFLGGDVHFSYLARARARGGSAAGSTTTIAQLVCSPTCNWMQPMMRRLMWVAVRTVTGLLCRGLARLAGVRAPVLDWRLAEGPWYDNALATLTLDGRSATVRWDHSPSVPAAARQIASEASERPRVRELAEHPLTG
ncbi:alkaline phosphatase D family protein [Nocardiopsis ansamitocini]|uniref:Metallophosphatase n=1 Tax=Nocardiopsis ansamitocini TaxID=1670832 RepID=A0A9W6P9L0_9ACTN|nr:alkaline phosphatase D family protein [Nocardiopsis ansamitocini]GLU49493.1 metallophosphatase [Nocardiopsis ansamitocini]